MKYLCLTLDLEQDYGREQINSYSSQQNIEPLLKLLKKYQMKLTVFVTGKILDEKPEIIEKFKNFLVEFELHSYSHFNKSSSLSMKEKIKEISKAKQAYVSYFNKTPIGYRAPQGIISNKEMEALAKEGFKYSSSLSPSWRPGLFNNIKKPVSPYFTKSKILEIPFSVIPKIRFPIALSYQQFWGWLCYKLAFSIFGWPNTIIYYFHLYNLKKTRNTKGLPIYLKLAYLRNQNKGLKILKKFIKFAKKHNYQSMFISELYNLYKK